MAETTQISWADATWNPWLGCTKVSQGCRWCYMYRSETRFGRDPQFIRRSKTTFEDPLRWKTPKRIFTCSLSDFFIEKADAWRADAWKIIKQTPHHLYLILTKRPERIAACLPADWGDRGWPNVWLGTSAENQAMADLRIPTLLAVPAALHFVSCEPLLGPIDLTSYLKVNFVAGPEIPHPAGIGYEDLPLQRAARLSHRLEQVIIGGESGDHQKDPKTQRLMDMAWARAIRDQCVDAEVSFFFKQDSDVQPEQRPWVVEEDGTHTTWQQIPEKGLLKEAPKSEQLDLFEPKRLPTPADIAAQINAERDAEEAKQVEAAVSVPAPSPVEIERAAPDPNFDRDAIILRRRTDEGAWHRAIEIARKLVAEGVWDGKCRIEFDAYDLHPMLFGPSPLPLTGPGDQFGRTGIRFPLGSGLTGRAYLESIRRYRHTSIQSLKMYARAWGHDELKVLLEAEREDLNRKSLVKWLEGRLTNALPSAACKRLEWSDRGTLNDLPIRQREMLLDVYHGRPIVKNGATHTALMEKGLLKRGLNWLTPELTDQGRHLARLLDRALNPARHVVDDVAVRALIRARLEVNAGLAA